MSSTPMPAIVDRATFASRVDELRVWEKAHTREGDAIAAARRRLPMVQMDPDIPLVGPGGPIRLIDAFEGRRQLMAYYFMWWPGRPAAEQCEGCTWAISQLPDLSYLHARDITFAVFCQGRNTAYTVADDPYQESLRYREFMGWTMPWYSAHGSLEPLLGDREAGLFHLICYLRDGDRVFETYWTKRRGVEAMDNSYGLMDLSVYGRQEAWEDSPEGWPRGQGMRTETGAPDWSPVPDSEGSPGRPIAQWPRVSAGRSDDLGAVSAGPAGGQHCCH